MRQFRVAWDRFSADPARLTEFLRESASGSDESLVDPTTPEPGFGIWLANFREIFMDEAADAELSEYIADRIRRRVKDPKVAEKLIPRDHGFGVQRLPLGAERSIAAIRLSRVIGS